MSDRYNCTEGCQIPSDSNEIKIMIKKLDRQVKQFYNDTTKSLLNHDHKLVEMCNTIKTNLSNAIRCLIDSMVESGEIDEIVRRVLLFNDPINIKDFRSSWRRNNRRYTSIFTSLVIS